MLWAQVCPAERVCGIAFRSLFQLIEVDLRCEMEFVDVCYVVAESD